MNELIDFLLNQDVEFKRNQKLSEYTSIQIGAEVPVILFPDSVEKFVKALSFLKENNIPFKVVGNMTNILPGDLPLKTVIVSTVKMRAFSISGEDVFCECGVLFSKFIINAANASLGGCESLIGIPGTVGAMISINAGAYGACASDRLSSVRVFDTEKKTIFVLDKEEISFSYRKSDIQEKKLYVLSALFKLSTIPKKEIYERIRYIRQIRRNSQPITERTLGSVFKRSENVPASYMIDRCGLKGMRIGNISVSEKHAGFFVNNGNGTAKDFILLADRVKECVFSKFGVLLTEEFEYFE